MKGLFSLTVAPSLSLAQKAVFQTSQNFLNFLLHELIFGDASADILLMLFLAVVMEAFERSYAELDAKSEAAMVEALAGQQPDDEALLLEGPGTHSSIAPPPGAGAFP